MSDLKGVTATAQGWLVVPGCRAQIEGLGCGGRDEGELRAAWRYTGPAQPACEIKLVSLSARCMPRQTEDKSAFAAHEMHEISRPQGLKLQASSTMMILPPI